MKRFVQLTNEDCQYLLDLIQDMDSETQYTEKQRKYTIPKLLAIQADPGARRLAFQDVDYLLELIEDDDLPETEVARTAALQNLLQIQALQNARFDETRSIEAQRTSRRRKRAGLEQSELQNHFARTTV